MNQKKHFLVSHTIDGFSIDEYKCHTLVVGSGCAAFNAADSLYDEGIDDVLIVTEGLQMGTSRNTGSDKQTYYKLSVAGSAPDSIYDMAKCLYDGQSIDGDTALVQAALSTRCFYKLIQKGVPFPHDMFGQYVGYKTDHDETQRGTSCGPLTSRFMTECLERSIKDKRIEVLDQVRIIHLLTKQENEQKIIHGAIGINKQKERLTFVRIQFTNIVYATGGPSGIYYNSVYPKSQTCAHGAAISAGVKLNNVTEWQYGIASVNFRWNLSGSYQQVIPRYVSTNLDGSDEREFLLDYFESAEDMLTAVFLKGYQWPFDPRKTQKGGSSLVDFAVYQETMVRGRNVYLDFTKNPVVATTKDDEFDFSLLKEEAYYYLKKSDILFGTPVERLKKLNQPAFDLFKKQNIDLDIEKIKISVCAQHNNGGFAVNYWWESNLKHFFPVGEACGSFGVYRPGGSALNATQVGALRAAQFIAAKYDKVPDNNEQFQKQTDGEVIKLIKKSRNLLDNNKQKKTPLEFRKEIELKMDTSAAFIRDKEKMQETLLACKLYYKNFTDEMHAVSLKDLTDAWINWDILVTQILYLQAMIEYEKKGGKSRGSYMIQNNSKILKKIQKEGLNLELDNGANKESIQVSQLREEGIVIENRKRKPLPKENIWFEDIYKEFHEGRVIGN